MLNLVCRNIRPLFNFDPPATKLEIQNASLQFVKKISGFTKASKVNEDVFEKSIMKISAVVHEMLNSLITKAPTKNRENETEKELN